MSRRVANYPDLPGNVAMLNRISTIGSFILGASTLFCLYNVYKTWRFGQRVPADGPVGVRELAGVGDLLPAAPAQLHPDPADPFRAPSVRSALPAHQVRPGQAARLVRPARRLSRQYRQPGQGEAARGLMSAAGRRVRLAEVTAGTLGSASAGSGRDGAVAWRTVATAGSPSRRARGQRATGTAFPDCAGPAWNPRPASCFLLSHLLKIK
jgi:hypothetical protein